MAELDPETEARIFRIRELIGQEARAPIEPDVPEHLGALVTAALTFAPTIVGHALLVVDFDGTILFANSGIVTYGYESGGDLAGRPLEVLIPSRLQDGFLSYVTDGAQGLKSLTGLVFPIVAKDGREVVSSVSIGKLLIAGQLSLVAMIHPVHTYQPPLRDAGKG